MKQIKFDIETIPDEPVLSLDHEALRPELRPVETNNFYSTNVRTMDSRLKKGPTVAQSKVILKANKMGLATAQQELNRAKAIEKWNKEIEQRRHIKQVNKQIKRLKGE